MENIFEKLFNLLVTYFDLKARSGDQVEKLNRSIEKLTVQQEKLVSVKNSLIRGIFSGFGFFLGSVALAALLIYILSLLDTIPIIGDFISRVLRQAENR